MLNETELKRRIEEAGKWYQDISYDDISPKCHFDDGKTNKNSYGVGRWRNYIKPLIEMIEHTADLKETHFTEIGCSAGQFLLHAWQEFYFMRVFGVEPHTDGFKQLLITKDFYDKMPLTCFYNKVGDLEKHIADSKAPYLDIVQFPMSHILLLSCVHYHIEIEALRHLLWMLSYKTLYLLIITDENARDTMPGRISYIEPYLKTNWRLWYEIETPRERLIEKRIDRYKNLTARIYRSRHILQMDVFESFYRQVEENDCNKHFYLDVFPKFIEDCLGGKILPNMLPETDVYKWQIEGRYGSTAWEPTIAHERTLSYYKMVFSIQEHGQEMPIILRQRDLWDGYHRIGVLKYFKYKYVYAVKSMELTNEDSNRSRSSRR